MYISNNEPKEIYRVKIFISADIEGISGITSIEQIFPGGRDYESARKLITKEVNIVVDAAFEYGASEILVNDSHFNKDNILIEELDSRVKLITGKYRPLNMMQGIDNSYNAVFFIGYHARAGTADALFDHTNIFDINNLKINEKIMGEMGMNARIAGCFGVPVIFLSGDQKAAMCAKEELNNPVTAVVKESISRSSVKMFPFKVVKDILRDGVHKAMSNIKSFQPIIKECPVKIEVSFNFSNMAEICALIPGVTRKDARTVIYHAKEYMEAYKVYRVMVELVRKCE